jgi:hypothetical protein
VVQLKEIMKAPQVELAADELSALDLASVS